MLQFETLLCLGIASFVGYFVLGLSGFGAGLLVICSWSVFKSVGINVGPIQLVIGADAISNMLVTIPFPFITQACIYGDYGIFGPIILLRNFANFGGAFLFSTLNEQLLELILGPVLLFLVVLKYAPKILSNFRKIFKQKNKVQKYIRLQDGDVEMQKLVSLSDTKLSTSQSEEKLPQIQKIDSLNSDNQSNGECQNSTPDEYSVQNKKYINHVENMELNQETTCCFNLQALVSSCVINHLQILYYILMCRCRIQRDPSTNNEYTRFIRFIIISSENNKNSNNNCNIQMYDSSRKIDNNSNTTNNNCNNQNAIDEMYDSSRKIDNQNNTSTYNCSNYNDIDEMYNSSRKIDNNNNTGTNSNSFTNNTGNNRMDDKTNSYQSVDSEKNTKYIENAICNDSNSVASKNSYNNKARDIQVSDQNNNSNINITQYVSIVYTQKWLKSLPVLSIAALCSGIMGGMVGIPGPPLMYAFQFLNLPKNVSRSNASVANSFNFRALFYLLFGSIQFEYWYLYICMVCCATLGLITGSILQKYLSTKAYHHVLLALVAITGIILLLRGSGVWLG
eukprot:TRINITY_DN13825_c0_g1_i6.p1 TRINITY_DN13825_c0_g1~~TRINITY_DN13825_c0_g1_i6.p1  ORF type:complete len:564 (-),score=37.39 TRINITY_DN13825_c0_g1_i6:590-2281(-)